ncbi:MAG: Glycerol-1-phosphate dehydrogenase [NAD(P)+] [Phycisphaerae bacterium]|nr:Glycerol-1-phosphate dehydrogenase [NAD(P)+] [Phycisphaerae bacterium]
MKTANEILARYADRLATRRVVCEPGLTTRMPALLADFLPKGRWLLVADANTWAAQGEALSVALSAAGAASSRLVLQDGAGAEPLVCDTALVAQVAKGLSAERASAVVAVGSGTICDTVKLAAGAAGLPSAAVATAPSMNGYPSVIAAVLRDGIKRTDPAPPPVVVLADLDVLCAAPARMIAAGLADLLAKPVSTADWTLANELLGDAISPDGLAVVEASAGLAEGIAPRLPAREPAVVAALFESLFVSGLAMAVSGKSSPASGGEHLISHYLDMTALAGGARAGGHDLHGLQVGVATLVTAEFYRRLLAWDPATLDVAARVTSRRPWAEVEAGLSAHFGPTLGPVVIGEARKLYAEGDALADRLKRLVDRWPVLRPRLAERLVEVESLEAELKQAGAATQFSQIGVGRERALAAVTHAHHVRARYTVLHLLADLGVLEDWARDAVARRGDA